MQGKLTGGVQQTIGHGVHGIGHAGRLHGGWGADKLLQFLEFNIYTLLHIIEKSKKNYYINKQLINKSYLINIGAYFEVYHIFIKFRRKSVKIWFMCVS